MPYEYQDYRNFLAGGPPPQTPPFTAGPSGGGAGAAGGAAPAAQAPQQQQGSPQAQAITSTLQTDIAGVRQGVAGVQQQFRQEAGPRRSYESAGVQPALERFATTGEGDPRSYLQANYQGPATLEGEYYDEVSGQAEKLRARGQALGTAGGVQTYIRQQNPGLTPGAARFEYGELRGDRGFQQELAGQRRDVRDVYQSLGAARRGATEYAGGRAEEEQGIATRSREYLEGRAGEERSAWETAVAAAEDKNRQLREDYDAYSTGGQNLLGRDASNETLNDLVMRGFLSKEEVTQKQAQDRYQELLQSVPGRQTRKGREADVATYGLLERDISPHGRESFKLTEEQQAAGIKKTGAMKAGTLAMEKEFRPTYSRTSKEYTIPEGALYKPTQGANELLLPEARTYLNFDPGMAPNAGNMSTEQQRDVYNRINEALDKVDRLDESQPFRAAAIAGDVEKYLADTEKAIKDQTGELKDSAKAWKKQIQRARKRYRKSKHLAKWVKVAQILNAGATLGLSELTGPVLGDKLEEKTGPAMASAVGDG